MKQAFIQHLLWVAVLALAIPGLAQAQHSQDFGDYVVYFNAFTTDTLPPQMAQSYDITRSKNRGLLNITVLKKVMDTPGNPVKANVKAQAVNLTGQLKELSIREVSDGNAVYYLSEFPVSNRETLDFTVDVTPAGTDREFTVTFRRQFFAE